MPTPKDTTRVPELFAEAQAVAPAERDAFLARACGGDDALRAEVESLLRCCPDTGDFLEAPADGLGAELLARAAAGGELRPGDLLGDCRIVSLLGVGGMGEVYLARDTTLDRPVALKLVQRGWGSAMRRQFQHERRVLAGLNHPHIARLYGSAVTPEGRAYLVMEYVEGERLDEYCRRRQLGVAERLALFRKVCAAVSYAHQNLVVHRDLKPANIRVTPEGEPKLLDFGIAKLLEAPTGPAGGEPTLTLGGAMTPEYASPEQLRGEAITTASDVYSLGVVFYELLGGQRPYRFPSRRPEDMARVICEQEPARLGSAAAHPMRRRLSGDLDNIAAMALRKEPARRYSSVAQFSEDIRRHEAGLPVIARKETLPYVAGRFVRRHKTAVAAAGFVTLALVGGLVATARQAHVADQERDRARLAQRGAELARRQAERLNGFLQTLLGSVNPDGGPGRDLKVVQVLDRAGQDIDRELAGDPAILAQAHTTLGQAYTGLKEAEPALRHLRAAVEIDRRLYGDGSLVTARAGAALGVALAGLERRYAEAEPLLRAALAVERRQPADGQRELPDLLKFLGMCVSAAGRFDEASALAAESLSLTRKTYGEQSEPFAKGLTQLGYLQMNQGDFAGAEGSFGPAAALYRRLSPGTPTFASSLANLAFSLIMQGKFDRPDALLQEALACYRATVGEASVNYHLTVGMRGLLHFERGEYPPAEADLRDGLGYLRPRVPESDRDVASGMLALGLALTRQGKAAEGETWLRDTLARARTYQLTGMAAARNVEAALAECLLAQKRFAEAEPLLLAGYDDVRTRLGEGHAQTAAAAARLRACYTAWGKPEQAARFP